MRNNKLIGTGVALVTPFHDDYTIDFASLERLIEHLIANHINYFVVLGTTGESATLSNKEQDEVLDFVKKKVNSRIPIVVGVGGNDTYKVINRINDMDLNGVEAILSVCPYYNKPSQKGLLRHYSMIAETCPIDIVLYNVPSRTALNIAVDTVCNLAARYNNIIGIKEASGDMAQCMSLIKSVPSDFLIISGDDKMTFLMMAAGGVGVISVQAMAFPKEFSNMVTSALNSKWDLAKRLHYKLLDSVDLFYIDGNPSGVKEALLHLNICSSSQLRLPLLRMEKRNSDRLKELLSS